MPPKPPKPPLTHFLCLPLITPSSHPQLRSSLTRFTNEVTTPSDSYPNPLPPKAIRPVGALHFTLGVMSLPTQERVEAACKFLKDLDILELLRQAEAEANLTSSNQETGASEPVDAMYEDLSPPKSPTTSYQDTAPSAPVDTMYEDLAPPKPPPPSITTPAPLTLTLTSLHAMQSPARTSSLYTSPSPPTSAHLYPLALSLQRRFLTANFLLPDTRPLKLHATIINTIYARSSTSGKNRWKKDSGKIDARALVERWEGYEWVRGMRMDRVAICEMGAKEVVEGGEVVDQVYKEVVSVPLP